MGLYILQGLFYGFQAAVQPGPLQTYLIGQTLQNGWKKALVYVFVPICSDLPIIAVILFVLKEVPPIGITILRIVGGAFLLYLAYGAFRLVLAKPEENSSPSTSSPASFIRAVFVNLLNPNPYLFWGLITGPILVAGWKENPAFGIGLLVAFYLMMMVVMTGILVGFGVAGQWNAKLRRVLLFAAALGLACFGMYQLMLGSSLIS